MTKTKKGFRLVKELESDEMVVAMMEFKGRIYIATNRRVFRTEKDTDKLIEIPFEVEDD